MQNISIGKSYHIDDSFFLLVNDPCLMSNKENKHYRPHFFFFADPQTPGIFWAVPQSSQVAKYQAIVNKKIAKNKKCDTIVIGNYGGTDNAFLIQNMFPIIDRFVDHEHTINGTSVTIHNGLSNEITKKALKVLSLYRKGHTHLLYPDANKIYDIMVQELQKP